MEEIMRIGLFSDTYLPDINGVATSVETLRKVLEENGHHVYVIANHKGLINLKREGNVLRLPGIELKWLYGYSMSSPLQLKAKDEIKAMNLDVIHVHTEFGVGIFGRLIAKELNIPLVSTYHTMYEDYTHYLNIFDIEIVEKAAKSLAGNLSRIANNKAQCVISPSVKTKEALISYGVDAPIHVIPTGIDLNRFNCNFVKEDEVKEIKELYGIQEDDHVIVYIGRIANEKAIDIVIRGFKKCAESDSKYKLLIVGGGPILDDLKVLSASLGLENSVIFTGYQKRELVPVFYRCGEAFVSCSTSETQGMTYIEAMSCSLPIFVRKDDVVLDLVDEGKSGYFIEEDTFSDKCIEFFNLPLEKRKEMGEYARSKVLQYDTSIFYKRVIECYEQAYASYFKTLTIKKVKSNIDYLTLTLEDNNDNEIKCLVSLEDYFAFGLKKDGIVHKLTLEELQRREVILKAWNLCIRKLSLKDRTTKEIKDILIKENMLDENQINVIIEKLENRGYINDTNYMLNHIEKMMETGEGKNKIIHTLVKKGLSYDAINQILESYDSETEKSKAIRFIKKTENSIKAASVKMKKQLLISKLIIKGYAFDIAKEVVSNYDFSEDFLNEKDALQKAIDKAVRMYSKKYTGYELKKMVLNQLIRKGFNSEDVLIEIEGMEIFYDEN